MIAAFFLSSILFGVSVHDTVTFIPAPAWVIVIALLAGYLPARRATRVDLVPSLRYEWQTLFHRSHVTRHFPQLSRPSI